ncbi:MAG: alpha/beta hydrolase [Pseudomonadota bacterium]
MTASTAYTVDAFDGHRIAVRRWDAVGTPRAAMLVSHGMAEHGERYAPLGEYLGQRGVVVYALDHRGHGRSIARPEDTGHYADFTPGHDGWARVVDDLGHVIQHVRAAHPDVPFVLLGHSMGSFIAQATAMNQGAQLDALALSGSNYGSTTLYRVARLIARLEKFRQGARGKSALLDFLSFGAFNKPFKPARTPYDWLSRDPAEVDKYIADPLCGFRVTNQLWIDLLGGLIAISNVGNLAKIPGDLPVYILGGDRDPVGQAGKGLPKLAARLREAGLRNVTLKLYGNGRHEMFNETNRAEVFADLAAWLGQALQKKN